MSEPQTPVEPPHDPRKITSTETVFPEAALVHSQQDAVAELTIYQDGPILSTLLVAGDLEDLAGLHRKLISFLRCALLDPWSSTMPSVHRLDLEGKPAFLIYYARLTEEFENASVESVVLKQVSEERLKVKGNELLRQLAAFEAGRVEVIPGQAMEGLGGLGGKR